MCSVIDKVVSHIIKQQKSASLSWWCVAVYILLMMTSYHSDRLAYTVGHYPARLIRMQLLRYGGDAADGDTRSFCRGHRHRVNYLSIRDWCWLLTYWPRREERGGWVEVSWCIPRVLVGISEHSNVSALSVIDSVSRPLYHTQSHSLANNCIHRLSFVYYFWTIL